jgi:hypothetical protein
MSEITSPLARYDVLAGDDQGGLVAIGPVTGDEAADRLRR